MLYAVSVEAYKQLNKTCKLRMVKWPRLPRDSCVSHRSGFRCTERCI